MTANITIEATPGQVAAVERDGFLVVAEPTISRREPLPTDGPDYHADHEAWVRGGSKSVPVPTTKPCPECRGSGAVSGWPDTPWEQCPACNGDGTVPIVVEVVVPERKCPKVGAHYYCECRNGTIPARTLLRGTAEAVPVVDRFDGLCSADSCLVSVGGGFLLIERVGEDRFTTDVTHRFADVPRPEVGDTAWIIRGEES